jgi:hypothetical protein
MKVRSFVSTIGLAIILACGAGAQTSVVPGSDAGFIRAPDWLRDVNGQLYDINKDDSWKSMDGDILKVSTKGIIVSTFTMEPIYQAATVTERMHPERDYLHASDARNDEHLVATKVQVGEKKVPGSKIILRNYPANLSPAIGQPISFRAMQVGTSDYNGDTLELWDYGTKPTQDELRKRRDEEAERQKAIARQVAEQRRAAGERAAAVKKATQDKVLKWHLEQAEKGDSYGLFRMGEHYRDGDGVPRDLDKAREYFTKAVAAGSPSAADALSKLNQPSTNSPASH